MPSTFHGIEMGKRSLITHTQAMNVTGHNLNNLNTEGYSRQVVHIHTFEPIYMPDLTREERPGQLGQGMITSSIVRVRDALLDNRIIFENNNLGYMKIRNKYIHQVEMVYGEPTIYNDPNMINTLRTSLDEFFNAWQEVVNHPEQTSSKVVLVEKAKILTNSVRHHFNQLTDIRRNIDKELEERVIEINQLAQKIAHLNDRILKSEAMKDNPNDLYDKRDLLIDRLSQIVDLQISREDKDELILYIGGRMLVQGAKYETLNLIPQAENDGYFDVYWKDGEKLVIRGGELASLVDLRDNDLYYEIKKIDSFAANVTDLVNEIHRNGFGANKTTNNNFFVEFPFTTDPLGNFDRNKDGIDDSTYLFKISGENTLSLTDKIGIEGVLNINGININYYSTDTLENVIERINQSGARVNAFLNPQGKLTLKADYQNNNLIPDFVIQHLEDSGFFLTGYAGILRESGVNGAYDWQQINQVNKLRENTIWAVSPLVHPAAYMNIEEKIVNDVNYIAVADGIDTDGDGKKDLSNGIGDSKIALKIASLKHERVMVGMSLTFSEYFEALISDIGSRGNLAEKGFKAAETILKNLDNLRKAISGVNIDEEFTNIIKYQHAYNATAKIMTEMDKMIETLIFRLGA